MLKINGQPTDAAGVSLLEYLKNSGLDPVRVAVELDGEIVPRTDYPNILLQEGQELEIVSFVGGG